MPPWPWSCRGGQELPSSSRCGRATDPEGRSLARPERPGVVDYLKVIRLVDDPDDPDDPEEAPLPA